MLEFVLGIIIGAIIGWNIPQPMVLKTLQERIVKIFKRK